MKRIVLIASIAVCSTAHPMLKDLFGTNKEIVATPTTPTQPQPTTNVAVPAGQTIIINNTLNNTDQSTIGSSNIMGQSQQSTQEALLTATQQMSQTMVATLKNVIQDGALKSKELLITFTEWVRNNKFKIIFGGVCASYAALAAYLARTNYLMLDESLWARWRIEDSYEQLASMDQKKLGQDLVFAIQRRYTTSAQFTDFIQPLVKFMQDLEAEKRFLKNYVSAAKWINLTYMQRILPINEKKIKLAKKLLQRIYFIEHVFLSWAAEFKIQQNV